METSNESIERYISQVGLGFLQIPKTDLPSP